MQREGAEKLEQIEARADAFFPGQLRFHRKLREVTGIRLDIDNLVNWGMVWTFLSLILSMVMEDRDAFTSAFAMNVAFTIIGSIFITVFLNELIQSRESARWSSFDLNNLIDVKKVIYELLYHTLVLPMIETHFKVNLPYPSDVLNILEFNNESSLEKFTAYTDTVKRKQDFLWENHKIALGNVCIKWANEYLRLLRNLDEVMKFLLISPYAPVERLQELRQLSREVNNLATLTREDWNIEPDAKAEAVAEATIRIVESSLYVYRIISEEIARRK